LGDAGNNSGITFATGRSAYWNLAGSQDWTATGWALTNSGVPAVANYPLIQDLQQLIREAGSAGTITLDTQGLMIGNITMARRCFKPYYSHDIKFWNARSG
jgi:hypothetical protein